VRIASVRVGGVLQPLPHLGRAEVDGLALGPGTSELQIEFFGVGFQAGEPLRYQYRLEGAAWSPPSLERTVHYARPSPGRYRFQVRAVTAAGVTSASPASVWFEVVPSLWRRGWFQALAMLSLGVTLYGGHRYRLTHLLALERLRTRIAADLHDEIGSSLARVAVLSDVARRQQAPGGEGPRRLEEIGDTARDLIAALGDIVWAVNPQRDDLASLVRRVREFAGDLLEEKGIGLEFQATTDLEGVRLAPEPRRQIFLVLKEALHNVARHAAASSATLRLDLVDGQLRAEVSDDGRGLSPLDRERDGQGLANMRARAARIGGRLEVDSAPGAGTRVVLVVPLPLPRGRMNVLWRRRPR
jgi:signal transduction histidine kinase